MFRFATLGLLIAAAGLFSACGQATCQEACDHLYTCMPDTTTPKTECVNKCLSDPGKGKPENRNCIAQKSCDELKSGKCPDLIVR